MSKHWNDFCLYCVGNEVKDIRECDDRDCPFFPFRQGDDFDEPGLCKQILRDTGTITNDK